MASTDFSQAAQGAVTSMAEKKDVITVEDTAQYDLEELPQKAKQVFNIDGFNVLGLDPEDADFYNNFSHADRQRTKHKVRDSTKIKSAPCSGELIRQHRLMSDSCLCSPPYILLRISIDPTLVTQRSVHAWAIPQDIQSLLSARSRALMMIWESTDGSGISCCRCSSYHMSFLKSLATLF